MKQNTSKTVREKFIKKLYDLFINEGEDCGMTASGTFNFPIVEGEEEGWVEIVVKVPKYEDNEGYELRNDYTAKCEEAKAKAEERKLSKERKIERDKKLREERKKAKEEKEDK